MGVDVANGAGERTGLPPPDMAAMLNLATFLEQHSEPAGLVGPDGETVPLPVEVYEVLIQVAGAMLAGKAITVAPLEQRLTTQQAADLLGVSRPTLVKLLETHEIPYEQPGRHRRVHLADVLDYRDRRRRDRRERLAAMTRQAVEDRLYEGDRRGLPQRPARSARGSGQLRVAGFGVVLDACVLVPVSLADTLLRIAAHARPGWHLGCHTSGTNSVIPEG